MNYCLSSINTDSKEGEHTGGDGQVGDKVVDGAVDGTKQPNPARKINRKLV